MVNIEEGEVLLTANSQGKGSSTREICGTATSWNLVHFYINLTFLIIYRLAH